MRHATSSLAILSLTALLTACDTGHADEVPPPGAPLAGTDLAIGDPVASGKLHVYPIVAARRISSEKILAFDAARERGDVAVREIDGGGSVGTVVVENKGKAAFLIMAGTVIKGGKQDRQIGQDVVVPPGKKVEVDAFCVEHGRWDEARDGRGTDGVFVGSGSLAPRKVREAGQYKANQHEVWENVATENEKLGKRASSGTLMATLDDREVKEAVAKARGEVDRKLRALAGWPTVVGLAYAVGGEVKGARWFHDHELLEGNARTLLSTMAVESLDPEASGTAAPTPKVVAGFLADLRASRVTEVKKTRSTNANRQKENAAGYSSETVVGDVEVSADYMAK